jgi:Tol biopolymer transport system component
MKAYRFGALLFFLFACSAPERTDTEVATAHGLRKDRGGVNGDFDYCTGTLSCNSGEGDCDSNAQCTAGLGLVCGTDNGPNFMMPADWDVCVPAHCTNNISDADEDIARADCGGSCGACTCPGVPGSAGYCSPSCPCGQGAGDCDSHADCAAGLICGVNNGPAFGLPAGFEVCIAPTFAQSPVTERVSVSSTGIEADQETPYIGVSTNGRYIVFQTESEMLDPTDGNGVNDCFLRDRQTRRTQRFSLASNGTEANAPAIFPAISGDGRFGAFVSTANNLVAGDTNNRADIFVRDFAAGITTRVNVSSAGVETNGYSHSPVFSENGRIVVFASVATNLVAGDTTGSPNADIFVHDRLTGTTSRVSISSTGVEANGDSARPSISADGRFVAFTSLASNLVIGDTNNGHDVFVHDRQTGTTSRVSANNSGTGGDRGSYSFLGALSGDGRWVTFASEARNLVTPDANNAVDIFVHDRSLGTTMRVNMTPVGTEANRDSGLNPSISRDGRYVTFTSFATNLMNGDTNNHLDGFVHDRNTGVTARASVSSSGAQPAEWTAESMISGNGRTIVFYSGSENLVPADTSMHGDVFATPNPL